MTDAELVGIAMFGLATTGSGVGVMTLPRALVPGLCLALGGLTAAAGAVTYHPAPTGVAGVLLAASATLLPLAMTTYPRPSWRHPVDVGALVTVLACSAVAVTSVVRHAWGQGELWIGGPAVAVALVLLLHLWWRIEQADPQDRRALTWLALSLTVAGTTFFFVAFAMDGVSRDNPAAGTVFGFAFALCGGVGLSMFLGLRRTEVVDVRGLIVRVVVFLTAVLTYMAVYAMIEAALELIGDRPPSVGTMALAAAFTAAAFHPVQVAMRGIIDELLFGRRPDPLGAAGQVAESIGDDPEVALDAIREALVLPHAQVMVEGRVVATSGTPVTHTRSFPLTLGAGRTGALLVGLRPGDLALTADDQRVLDLALPLLAQSLRAQLLADELQESREQTITAIEEERRRLRRDLHDGLGPRLSGIAFTSDAAGNTLKDDPEAAGELLRSLRAETATAIQEIRELVYGMRPPALDELGLVPAIRQQAGLLRTGDGRPMRISVDAEELPALTAALEVAAYRIAVEALTNAARHSGSDEASARLGVEGDSLLLEVRDGGASNGQWPRGVGLSSMRERAAELGGTLEAGYADGGGRVRAVLPL